MSEFLDYFRKDMLPTIWCSGCGHGIVTGALVRAIRKSGLDRDRICIVSGIGCSSRASGYLDFDTVHATHGRALAFATGIKFARPELKVIVMMGDGDCAAIGGNHFIHAARRNIDLTTIVMNNTIFGMTGGQCSPLSATGVIGSTSTLGNLEPSFDLCELAKAAGASYVGRATAYHAALLTQLIEAALANKGFSLVEAIVQCPTNFGRRNHRTSPVSMLKWLRDNSVLAAEAASLPPERLGGRWLIGELHNAPAPEFSEKYRDFADRLQAGVEPARGGYRGCVSNFD